jgi:16S rRNA (cytidine1402-2'-O)-methyltransferase
VKSGKDLIVVSDAGSPAISDPSESLVQEAIAQGIQVFALPGASALIPSITSPDLARSNFNSLFSTHSSKKTQGKKYLNLLAMVFPQ